MKKRILAICDAEEEYARRFCDYVRKKEEYPFEAAAFTSREKIAEFCEREAVEILLVSEGVYDSSLKDAVKGEVILLSGEKPENAEDGKIYKYQSCDNVLREALSYYAKQRPSSIPKTVKRTSLGLIGMYTPVHRCMQTTFALTLGQILAKKHKVLYLNFESFSGLEKRLDQNFMSDLSDLLYYVANAREAFFYKLKGMTQKINGLDYIPPAFSYMDIQRITLEQWMILFKELEKTSNYEYVILDLSDNMQGLFDILRMCRKVFTLIREDGAALSKIAQYEQLLEKTRYEDVIEKSKKYKLPIIRQLPFALEQLTYGELNDYIQKIVSEEFDGE